VKIHDRRAIRLVDPLLAAFRVASVVQDGKRSRNGGSLTSRPAAFKLTAPRIAKRPETETLNPSGSNTIAGGSPSCRSRGTRHAFVRVAGTAEHGFQIRRDGKGIGVGMHANVQALHMRLTQPLPDPWHGGAAASRLLPRSNDIPALEGT
jgi:hypothetical protein